MVRCRLYLSCSHPLRFLLRKRGKYNRLNQSIMRSHEDNLNQPQPPSRDLLPLPALAAISLYLLALAVVIILGVVAGRHYPPLFLVFAA